MAQEQGMRDLVRAARVYAAEQVEWLAPALYAAPLVLSEALPAPAAIDQYGRVYVHPNWLTRLQGDVLKQVGFLLVHEVWHWLREHNSRAAEMGAEPRLWNLACDMEINDYVPPGLQMPDFGEGMSCPTPDQFGLPAGKTAEWYYRQLRQRVQESSPSGSSSAGRGNQAASSQAAQQGGSQRGDSQPEEENADATGASFTTPRSEGEMQPGVSPAPHGEPQGEDQPQEGGGSELADALSSHSASSMGGGTASFQGQQGGSQGEGSEEGAQQQRESQGEGSQEGAQSSGSTGSSPFDEEGVPSSAGNRGSAEASLSDGDALPRGAGNLSSAGGLSSGSPLPQRGRGEGGEGIWDEGSGVHGQPRAWELPADSPEAHALSDFDRQSLREEVARRILEAQKTRGTMPAGLVRWAEQVVQPRVN